MKTKEKVPVFLSGDAGTIKKPLSDGTENGLKARRHLFSLKKEYHALAAGVKRQLYIEPPSLLKLFIPQLFRGDNGELL